MASKECQIHRSGRKRQNPVTSPTTYGFNQHLRGRRSCPSTALRQTGVYRYCGTRRQVSSAQRQSSPHGKAQRFTHQERHPSRSMSESLKLVACNACQSLRKFVPMFLLSLLYTRVASDDGKVVTDDDMIDGEIFPEDSHEEWYMILAFSLMFGFFITLFGAMVAYFSFMQDILMRRYIREGELIRADVMSAEFARGGGQVGMCSQDQQPAEYITFVEYTRQLSINYSVRVRKQMKAKETDFIRPHLPGSNGMLMSIKLQVGNDDESDKERTSDDSYYDRHYDNGPILPQGTFPSRDTIELYVLPEYPKSGHPRHQVERACSYRYRLSTAALVAFDIALAIFCTRIAAEAIIDLEDVGQRRLGWYAIGIFLMLVVLEIPLIHCFLKEFFSHALRDEYLESGEFVPLDRDDSSISTAGSDIFLTMTRCVSPRSVGRSVSGTGE